MNEDDHQTHEEKPRGALSVFFDWWRTPYSSWSHFSRTDPRIMFILATAAVAFMIFGGIKGLIGGAILLWFLATILIPALCAEGLCRRFGSTLGMIIALALTAGLWMPMFGIH